MKPWNKHSLFPAAQPPKPVKPSLITNPEEKSIYPTQYKRPTAADFFDEDDSDQQSNQPETSLVPIYRHVRTEKPKRKKKKKTEQAALEVRFDEKDYVNSTRLYSNEKEYFQYIQGEQVTIHKWTLDFFGDHENSKYYTVKKSKVPKFRRTKGLVIGEQNLQETQRVIAELDQKMGLRTYITLTRPKRYFQFKPSTQLIHILPAFEPFDTDFIPLLFSPVPQSEQQEELMLKSNKHYSTLLQQFPSDTSLWLDFINSQDSFYHKKSVLLDKKLSILDKVLSDPSPSLSILPLILEQLTLYEQKLLTEYQGIKAVGENELASNKLSELYRYYLSRFPDAKELWSKYMIFCMTEYSKFSVSNFRDVIHMCINLLKPFSRETQFREILIYICCFAAKVEMLCGYEERAIGVYVGLIEFCGGRKELNSLNFGDKLKEYEKIWESDQGKIGLEGIIQVVDQEQLEANSFEEWIEIEKKCEMRVGISHNDALAEKYPDSVVLFEDILPYLLPFQLSEPELSTLIVNLLNMFGISLPQSSPSSLFLNLESSSSIYSTLFYFPIIPSLPVSILSFLCNTLFTLYTSYPSYSHSLRWQILLILLESSLSQDRYTKQILQSSKCLLPYIAYMHISPNSSRIYTKIYKPCRSSLYNKLWLSYVYFLDRLDHDNETDCFSYIYRVHGSSTSSYLQNLYTELHQLNQSNQLDNEEVEGGMDIESICGVLSMWCVYYEEGVDRLIKYAQMYQEIMSEVMWCSYVRILEYAYKRDALFKKQMAGIVKYALNRYPNNFYLFRMYVDLDIIPKFILLPQLKRELHLNSMHWKYLIHKLPYAGKEWILNDTRQDSTDSNCISIWQSLLISSPLHIKSSMARKAVSKHPAVKSLYLHMDPEETWMILTEKELRIKVEIS